MSVDHSLQVRRGILPMLKAEPVVASMTSGRVFSEAPPALPTRPFIRYGGTDGTPTSFGCVDGSENAGPIHVFADTTDECYRLRKAVIRALDGKTKQLEVDPDTGKAATAIDIQVTLCPAIFRDTDSTACWHGVVNWTATVADDF